MVTWRSTRYTARRMERTQKPKNAIDIPRGGGKAGGDAASENTTGYMKSAKPAANTMIARHANKIRCISRRSRLSDGTLSKACITMSPTTIILACDDQQRLSCAQ